MNSAIGRFCLPGGFSLAIAMILSGVAGCSSNAPPAAKPQADQRDVSPLVKRDKDNAATQLKDAPSADAAPDLSVPHPYRNSSDDPEPLRASGLAASALDQYAHSIEHLHTPLATAHSAPPPPAEASHLTPQAQLDRPADPPPTAAPQPAPTVAAVTASNKVPGSDSTTSDAAHSRIVVADGPPGSAAIDLAKFDKRAREYPGDISAQIDDQLARLLCDAPVGESQSLAGLAPEDRELVAAILDSMVNFRSQLREDTNLVFSQKIRPLVELADRLHQQAELTVPTVALCTGVKAFGVYEPINPARFIASQALNFVVYCEVENFTSQLAAKNMYETRLAQDIVLYSDTGQPIWNDKRSVYSDVVRRRRHDFFVAKIISLPPTLPIGKYSLKVTVEDALAHHVAENEVQIEITAQMNWNK